MGLDVYLYKYEDFEKVIFAEDEYERLSGEAWRFGGKKYEELTDDEKDYARERDKVFMLSLGLVGYGESPLKQEVELPSSKYPDHYFKIGYFRSSYNEGGVDHILRDRTGHELATIFDVNGNYRVKPNWETARKKAVSVLDSLKKYGEGLDWYIHALEIVIETIDYVLAQSDPDKYYLHWNG